MVDTFDAIRPIMSRATMLAPLEPDGIELRVRARAPQPGGSEVSKLCDRHFLQQPLQLGLHARTCVSHT